MSAEAPAPRDFLPCVRRWFTASFDAPSPVQVQAWPVIRDGQSTLLLAPTGSGKTLAAFLAAVNDLFRKAEDDMLTDAVHVLYVSPVKALANDIQRNLLGPLEGIRKHSRRKLPDIRVAVRSGDTPAAERQRMIRRPPHILITTPESLFLLLGSRRMRPHLRSVRTVIVDEVHSLCDNKRGVHLSLSLERLEALVDGPLQRIGCSATVNPIEQVASWLVGKHANACQVINAGMRKSFDVQVVAPLRDFLEAGQTALWSSAYERLIDDIRRHRTTLIFANSRYKAERTALRLGELAPPGMRLGTHHGSMAREVRLEAEDALKQGRLDALVATSTLELGIDVGSVDLVYQIESPKTVAAGLQRIGRAGHLLDATSKGRVLIFSRDELLEAAAICRAMLHGQLDPLSFPSNCLDVLAQQIAGHVAAEPTTADELFRLVRRAHPYAELSRADFDAVLAMLAGEHAFNMARAPASLILWDRSTGRLSPSRSCTQAANTGVGTIPESTNYEVIIHGTKRRVGTVHSEFVDDSLRSGDVFVLGSTPWRVAYVRRNQLFVEEAPGSTPTVPWWLGDIQSRSFEAGTLVGQLRREIAGRINDPDLPSWLEAEYRLCPHAAAAAVDYVREQLASASLVPDERHLLAETWKDELGRFNVVLHSPFGMRINRTWGLAICAAASKKWRQDWSPTATNDILLLTRRESATPPLHEITATDLLASVTERNASSLVEAAASHAVSGGAAFRDAAVCALQIRRMEGGKHVPPWLRTYRAQELFEAAERCHDYPILREVRRQHVQEHLDLSGLLRVLSRIMDGSTSITHRTAESPSPFAHGILIADRYTEGYQVGRDRRAELLRLHRQVLEQVLSQEQMAQLLDPRAIEKLELRLQHRSEKTRAQSPDELAQVLRDLGDVPADLSELAAMCEDDPAGLLTPLIKDRRVVGITLPENPTARLLPADLWQEYHDAFTIARQSPPLLRPSLKDGVLRLSPVRPTTLPAKLRRHVEPSKARASIIARWLRRTGPVTAYELINRTGWPIGAVEKILDKLVAAGSAARGVYTTSKPSPQWVDRTSLEEIHRQTLGYLKHELAACSAAETVDFISRWQHLQPADRRLRGVDGLRQVIAQLQGLEAIQGAWETDIFPSRVADYTPAMLDQLIASGQVVWRRIAPDRLRRGPITFCLRQDLAWLTVGSSVTLDGARTADCDIATGILAVRDHLRREGSAYFDDLKAATNVDEITALRAIWHLAWCGEAICDTYACLRRARFEASLSGCYDLMHRPDQIGRGRVTAARVAALMKKRGLDPRLGRWTATERLRPPRQPLPESDVMQRWTRQLLDRWGIITRDLLATETAAPPWDALLRQLKHLELLGKVTRGYFIADHHGEQYGLPEAIELLRDCRARRDGSRAWIADEPVYALSNHDPANLFAACLSLTDDAGREVERPRALALGMARMAFQAGQPLLLARGHQLVRMTGPQLGVCLEQLKRHASGDPASITIWDWNSYPTLEHPAARVLVQRGFVAARHGLVWPPPRGAKAPANLPAPADLYLPQADDPPPIPPGPAYAIARAAEPVRELLKAAIEWAVTQLEPHGWTMIWDVYPPTAAYRGVRALRVRPTGRYVEMTIRLSRLSELYPQYQGWGRLTCLEEFNHAFKVDFRGRRDAAMAMIDRKIDATSSQGQSVPR